MAEYSIRKNLLCLRRIEKNGSVKVELYATSFLEKLVEFFTLQ